MCAQHCINALIQQPHFHAVLLAEIATQLDTQEREQYLKGGADSPDYLRAMQVQHIVIPKLTLSRFKPFQMNGQSLSLIVIPAYYTELVDITNN